MLSSLKYISSDDKTMLSHKIDKGLHESLLDISGLSDGMYLLKL